MLVSLTGWMTCVPNSVVLSDTAPSWLGRGLVSMLTSVNIHRRVRRQRHLYVLIGTLFTSFTKEMFQTFFRLNIFLSLLSLTFCVFLFSESDDFIQGSLPSISSERGADGVGLGLASVPAHSPAGPSCWCWTCDGALLFLWA